MSSWWLMWCAERDWKFVRADGPCWKGEIRLGRLVLGWQARKR